MQKGEPMDDLISRQSAIEACLKYNGVGWVWSQILNEIEALPSAERHGHWIKTRMPVTGAIEIKCSECDQKYYTAFQLMWNYCPNCGARMDGEQP